MSEATSAAREFHGVSVSSGRVVASVKKMTEPLAPPQAHEFFGAASTAESESAKLTQASTDVAEDLTRAADAATPEAKAILEATALMAKDPSLRKAAIKKIQTGVSAEAALWYSAEEIAAMLTAHGGYMAERVRDVYDVRSRIVAKLRGVRPPGLPTSKEPYILIADDLAPADTAGLDPALVLALVTAGGGPQSHTAILARALGIPAIVAAHGVTEVPEGETVFIDGGSGVVRWPATAADTDAAAQWTARAAQSIASDGQGQLSDGVHIPLLANVGNADDALAAAEAKAEGVGLFRTEFLFLNRPDEPTIEEQRATYHQVLSHFPGQRVVLRTLDAGADKPLPFLGSESEPNPALGVRGYRTVRHAEGILARQLDAIAEAAAHSEANVWVMAPMVSTADEAEDFVYQCHQRGLSSAGVMIEVPSAAMTAADIAHNVSFVSIGTNDLTQYVMAADREVSALAELNDPWQPAVLRTISLVPTGTGSVPVGVCGEAAADPALAVVLVGLGVSSLSMSARAIPAVAAALRSVTLAQARSIAHEVLGARSAAAAKSLARKNLPILEELGL